MFSQVTIMGRVTADLQLKTSANKVPFVGFSAAVNKGRKDQEQTATFYQCVLYREEAERIMKAGVKKGSLLMITGDLDMIEYESKTRGMVKEPKITVDRWEYVPIGNTTKQDSNGATNQSSSDELGDYTDIDCDDELPL